MVNGEKHRTRIRHSTNNPIWNQLFTITYNDDIKEPLQTIYVHDTIGSVNKNATTCVGYIKIPITHLNNHRIYDDWFTLRPVTKKVIEAQQYEDQIYHKKQQLYRIVNTFNNVQDDDIEHYRVSKDTMDTTVYDDDDDGTTTIADVNTKKSSIDNKDIKTIENNGATDEIVELYNNTNESTNDIKKLQNPVGSIHLRIYKIVGQPKQYNTIDDIYTRQNDTLQRQQQSYIWSWCTDLQYFRNPAQSLGVYGIWILYVQYYSNENILLQIQIVYIQMQCSKQYTHIEEYQINNRRTLQNKLTNMIPQRQTKWQLHINPKGYQWPDHNYGQSTVESIQQNQDPNDNKYYDTLLVSSYINNINKMYIGEYDTIDTNKPVINTLLPSPSSSAAQQDKKKNFTTIYRITDNNIKLLDTYYEYYNSNILNDAIKIYNNYKEYSNIEEKLLKEQWNDNCKIDIDLKKFETISLIDIAENISLQDIYQDLYKKKIKPFIVDNNNIITNEIITENKISIDGNSIISTKLLNTNSSNNTNNNPRKSQEALKQQQNKSVNVDDIDKARSISGTNIISYDETEFISNDIIFNNNIPPPIPRRPKNKHQLSLPNNTSHVTPSESLISTISTDTFTFDTKKTKIVSDITAKIALTSIYDKSIVNTKVIPSTTSYENDSIELYNDQVCIMMAVT